MEISVIPDEPMVDEKLQIVITGLKPDQKVTLKSSFTDQKSDFFSSACFVSDEEGNVHIHKQPSLSGTYTGVDGMGPFWSMIPQRKGSRYIKRDVTTPQVVHLSMYDGHYSCTDCNNITSAPILSKELRRWFLHKTVTRKEVRCGRLRGTLFIPQGEGPFPGVIDIFGGVGGLVESRAALLASKGFVSYALAYFNFDDLPKEFVDVNFDYLQETVTWFNSLPNVIENSLGLYGSSIGGDIALMLAIKCPQIRAVVNVNGFPFCGVFPLGPFTDYVKLSQNVCVDERIVGFKGRHQLKQYLSNKKAHKWGIKLWILAESSTGYTHQMHVYKGRRHEARSPNGQGYQVVTDLMAPHLNLEHHVTVDSFFTSPKLVHDLKESGTFCTGTVIKSRRGMPTSYRNARLQKGEMIVKSQGPVMAILWSDRRLVKVLTSTGAARMDEGVYQIPGDEIRMKHFYSADYTPEKILKTWDSNAKILYIVGEDDQCVHPRFAQELYNHYPEDRRHNLVIKRYPKVGHLIEPPYTPICLLTYNPTYKKYDVFGGIRKHQIRAEEDSWPRILNFFKSTLSPNSSCSNKTTSHL